MMTVPERIYANRESMVRTAHVLWMAYQEALALEKRYETAYRLTGTDEDGQTLLHWRLTRKRVEVCGESLRDLLSMGGVSEEEYLRIWNGLVKDEEKIESIAALWNTTPGDMPDQENITDDSSPASGY